MVLLHLPLVDYFVVVDAVDADSNVGFFFRPHINVRLMLQVFST